MGTFTIPNSQGQIRQDNQGDTKGELWETFNCDLSSVIGKIKVSKRAKKILDQVGDLDSSAVTGFYIFTHVSAGTFYYVTSQQTLYRCPIASDPTVSTNWVSVETAFAANGTDMVAFGGLLLVSQNTDIGSFDGNTTADADWWTTIAVGGGTGTALTANVPHTLHVHNGGAETLFVTDGNKVRYANEGAGHSTVTLKEKQIAVSVDSGVNAVWVGTYSETSDTSYVYEIYVGEQLNSVAVARTAYPINATAVLSVTVLGNTPYIFTSNGEWMVYNGAGFVRVDGIPTDFASTPLSGVSNGEVLSSNRRRPVHPRGMRVVGKSIFTLINTKGEGTVDTVQDRCNSGIWELNTATGQATHRYSLADSTNSTGASTMGSSGPLLMVRNLFTDFLAGGSTIDQDGGVYGTTTTTPKAYFVTSEIESGTVASAFESAYVKAKTMASGEGIQLKYRYVQSLKRVGEKDRVLADFALANPNVINTTDDVSTVEVGDEVTVTSGVNAGNIAHITKIEGTTTKSLTLDTDIGVAGDAVRVEIENWKLHPETYDSTNGEYFEFGVGENAPWIQYKVVMDGDIEFRQFISKDNSKAEL